MRKRYLGLVLVVAMVPLLAGWSGCASQNPPQTALGQAARVMDVQGKLVEATAHEAASLCKKGSIPAPACTEIGAKYDEWNAANETGKHLLEAWQASGSAADAQAYSAALDGALRVTTDLINLFAKYVSPAITG